MKLVGVGAVDVDALFQDQDSADSGQIELFTPAFTHKVLECCSNDMESGITLQGGVQSPYFPKVESELRAVLPKGVPFTYVQAPDALATAERTLKPESIALAVFGGIAGLAALLIAGQMIGRRIRLNADELDVLRALGADPKMTIADGLIGTLGAVLVGTVLAGLVAVGLSPLGPLGPIRPLAARSHSGSTGLWSALGMAVLAVALGAVAVVVAFRAAPIEWPSGWRGSGHRASPASPARPACHRPPSPGSASPSNPVRAATRCRSGRPSSAPCWRSAVVIGTITFGSSMNTLVSHPALYGWNWSDEINGGGGLGDIPAHARGHLLNADPYGGGWTGVYFSTLQIDGMNVPVMGGSPNAAVGPPLLSGHALRPGQPGRARGRHPGPAAQARRRHRQGGRRRHRVARRCGSSGRPPCPPSG